MFFSEDHQVRHLFHKKHDLQTSMYKSGLHLVQYNTVDFFKISFLHFKKSLKIIAEPLFWFCCCLKTHFMTLRLLKKKAGLIKTGVFFLPRVTRVRRVAYCYTQRHTQNITKILKLNQLCINPSLKNSITNKITSFYLNIFLDQAYNLLEEKLRL